MAISKTIEGKDLQAMQELFNIRGMMTKCATDTNIHAQTIKRIKVVRRGEADNIDAIITWVRKNRKFLIAQKQTA